MDKQAITNLLNKSIEGAGLSRRKWAESYGISSSTINNIINGNWDNISRAMWQKVANFAGYSIPWKRVETPTYRTLTALFNIARTAPMSTSVVGEAGSGKSFTAEDYSNISENVYYLQCRNSWNKRVFFQKMAKCIGLDATNIKTSNIPDLLIEKIRTFKDKVLIIIDEADKLGHKIDLFIELYNEVKDVCGFVLLGAPFLRNNIINYASRNKRGYKEILSRLGQTFLQLDQPQWSEAIAIGKANGLSDCQLAQIKEGYEGDLRYIERKVVKNNLLK